MTTSPAGWRPPPGWRPPGAVGRGMVRRARLMPRLALVLLAAAAVALTGPVPAAQAHAFLTASNPSDGQVLVAAPALLRLDFSESVVLGATRVDLVDGTGQHIAATGLRLVNQAGGRDIEQPVEVVASLPTLARGSYRVSWETLSSDDLHATSGVLVFGVGQSVTAGGLAEPAPSPVESGLRWLILLGLSGALGGSLGVRLLNRAGLPEGDPAAQLAQKVSGSGAVIAAGVAVVLLVSQLAAGSGRGMALLWSSYGVRWGVREAGLLLLVCSATPRVQTLTARSRRLLLLAGATLATVGTALLGHSGAGASPSLTRVIASAAHLGAAATWAGCLVVLAVLLVGKARSGAPSRDLTRNVLRGFGRPAAACVSVLAVTGVYLSSSVIGSVDAALFTIYGRILLAKVILAGVAGCLALVTTRRLRRRGQRAAPRRTVIAEAVAAIGVLALAAVLTSAQPAMEPQLVGATTSASTVVDGPVADLQEAVSIRPNRPGASVVLVDVYDTRRPSPGPFREVLVSVLGPNRRGEPLRAERLSNGSWSLATRLVDPGPVQVQVLVRRSGLPDATRSFAWTIGRSQARTREAVVSTAPINSFLTVSAAMILFLILALWLLVPLRRRHRLPNEPREQFNQPESAAAGAREPSLT